MTDSFLLVASIVHLESDGRHSSSATVHRHDVGSTKAALDDEQMTPSVSDRANLEAPPHWLPETQQAPPVHRRRYGQRRQPG